MKLIVTITKELDDSWCVTAEDSDEVIIECIKENLVQFVDSSGISVEREMSSDEALGFMRTKYPSVDMKIDDSKVDKKETDEVIHRVVDEMIY